MLQMLTSAPLSISNRTVALLPSLAANINALLPTYITGTAFELTNMHKKCLLFAAVSMGGA